MSWQEARSLGIVDGLITAGVVATPRQSDRCQAASNQSLPLKRCTKRSQEFVQGFWLCRECSQRFYFGIGPMPRCSEDYWIKLNQG